MRLLLLLPVLALSARLSAEEPARREPGPEARGAVYEWETQEGLAYRYRTPERYDPDRGVGLTVILHGSNLDRRWGFANHRFDTFRPDDVVAVPDGTTPNGQGGYNFLGRPEDVARFRGFLQEMRRAFRVRAVYLYGHSQGSFFALHYAGEHPDEIQGIVAHASGLWTSTRIGAKGHEQAIVLMHGTADPVVPFGQSVAAYRSLVEAKYPHVRLRALEGWNHWPAEHNGPVPHTSQQLAWCEGMTTDDPERLRACFDLLAEAKSPETHDWSGLYGVARRILDDVDAPGDLESRAARAAAAVERLAQEHASAFRGVRGSKFEAAPWVGHLPLFLRGFAGVPACDALARQWRDTLERQEKAAVAELGRFFDARRAGKPDEAFAAGVGAVRKAFLDPAVADPELRKQLAEWRGEAKSLRLSRKAIAEYDALLPAYTKAIEEGVREFYAENAKARDF